MATKYSSCQSSFRKHNAAHRYALALFRDFSISGMIALRLAMGIEPMDWHA
jgi:hypothetical protein